MAAVRPIQSIAAVSPENAISEFGLKQVDRDRVSDR
jgi:hypothetical protein